jgi:hypothetical protein
LALNVAAEAGRSAETLKTKLQFGDAPSPGGTARNLQRDSTDRLFDYFEKCLVSVVFSVQALEAYSNYKLAFNLKKPLQVDRRGKTVTLPLDEAERELSLDEKIGAGIACALGPPVAPQRVGVGAIRAPSAPARRYGALQIAPSVVDRRRDVRRITASR